VPDRLRVAARSAARRCGLVFVPSQRFVRPSGRLLDPYPAGLTPYHVLNIYGFVGGFYASKDEFLEIESETESDIVRREDEASSDPESGLSLADHIGINVNVLREKLPPAAEIDALETSGEIPPVAGRVGITRLKEAVSGISVENTSKRVLEGDTGPGGPHYALRKRSASKISSRCLHPAIYRSETTGAPELQSFVSRLARSELSVF
jgi:hypothetical protein